MKKYTLSELLHFLIPSVVGLLLFVIPLPFEGKYTLGVGMMAEITREELKDVLPLFAVILLVLSATLSSICILIRPKRVVNNHYLSNLLMPKWPWLVGRILGAIFAVITYIVMSAPKETEFNAVFAIIGNAYIGQVILGLLPILITWFLFAGFLLPILLQFGLMEFFGTLIRKFMKPVFTVPGRSAIDATTSWIGSGPLGVVVTDKQYKMGFYTGREAAVIACCFSLVSLPFSYVVADALQLSNNFLMFYVAIFVASIVAAIILPRIYPLSRKADTYNSEVGQQIAEEAPEGVSTSKWALEKAIDKARHAPNIGGLILEGVKIVVDVFLSLIPLVMAIGTIALIIAEKTTIFQTLAAPLVILLEAVGLQGADKAAPAMLIGFLDMYLPTIMVKTVEFEMTRFVIGALSFTQLVYMTETGTVILRSDIPVNLFDLIVVFLLRTIITFPIILGFAYMVY